MLNWMKNAMPQGGQSKDPRPVEVPEQENADAQALTDGMQEQAAESSAQGAQSKLRAQAMNGHRDRLSGEDGSDSETSPYPSPSYREAAALYGHSGSTTALEFSPDGTRLLSAGTDKLIKVWSVRTGAIVHTLQGHRFGINDACWSKDSKYIASASDDKLVKIWNAQTVSCAYALALLTPSSLTILNSAGRGITVTARAFKLRFLPGFQPTRHALGQWRVRRVSQVLGCAKR
jgi:WD domain, G-beta repeat